MLLLNGTSRNVFESRATVPGIIRVKPNQTGGHGMYEKQILVRAEVLGPAMRTRW